MTDWKSVVQIEPALLGCFSMGRSFRDDINDDAVRVFLNTNEFAELITYTPNGGTPVEIPALIREEEGGMVDHSHSTTLTRRKIILIADTAADGIVSPGVDDSFEYEEGGEIGVWTFPERGGIVSHSGGLWKLRFVKTKLTRQGFSKPNQL